MAQGRNPGEPCERKVPTGRIIVTGAVVVAERQPCVGVIERVVVGDPDRPALELVGCPRCDAVVPAPRKADRMPPTEPLLVEVDGGYAPAPEACA